MTLTSLILTAFGLAMDAVAVAIASGLAVKKLRWRDAFKMAAFFGAFQAAMPLAGYLIGLYYSKSLIAYNHWIAFALLVGLGLKMIVEAIRGKSDEMHSPFRTNKLIVLSIATSLDAFAVGVSFSLLDTGLLQTVAVIGAITFALCVPAVWLGHALAKRAAVDAAQSTAKGAEALGGVVLIAIGIKILAEHFLTR
jgi:manganese efflux pump family protein